MNSQIYNSSMLEEEKMYPNNCFKVNKNINTVNCVMAVTFWKIAKTVPK